MKFEFEEPAFNPNEPLRYLEGGAYMPRSIKATNLNSRMDVLKAKIDLTANEKNELDILDSIFTSIEVCLMVEIDYVESKLDIVLVHQDTLIDKIQNNLPDSLPHYLVVDWPQTAQHYAMLKPMGRVEIAGTPYYFD